MNTKFEFRATQSNSPRKRTPRPLAMVRGSAVGCSATASRVQVLVLLGRPVESHAVAGAQIAADEAREVLPRSETEHRRDLLQTAAPGLGTTAHRERHDNGRHDTKEQHHATRPHLAIDHRRGDESTTHVRWAPAHGRAKAHRLAPHTQRHDLRDVQPDAEAPRDTEGKHEAEYHCVDHVTGSLRDSPRHDSPNQHRDRHACHAEDQQAPATGAVHETEAADAVA
mmetsp:Transcript_5834/g.17261  ORF Transcript_5834/g.17261 Transcript_5834/m.17261 type:complete len:225 (+) Transcript_5834:299-973(+)